MRSMRKTASIHRQAQYTDEKKDTSTLLRNMVSLVLCSFEFSDVKDFSVETLIMIFKKRRIE
jgi:hypothetical protein